MSAAQDAITKLDEYVIDLNARSDELANTARRIDAMQSDYDDFIRDFEVDLYERCAQKGERLPGDKDLRRAMALKAMPDDFRREYDGLLRKRERLRKRISDLKAAIEAQRSVLSAEKVVMEAGGA